MVSSFFLCTERHFLNALNMAVLLPSINYSPIIALTHEVEKFQGKNP